MKDRSDRISGGLATPAGFLVVGKYKPPLNAVRTLIVLMMILRRKWTVFDFYYFASASFASVIPRIRRWVARFVQQVKCSVFRLLQQISILVESHPFSPCMRPSYTRGFGRHADARASLLLFSLDGERRSAVGWRCQLLHLWAKRPVLQRPTPKKWGVCILHPSFSVRHAFFLGRWFLSEFSEGKRVGGDHVAQGIQEQVRILPAIESEGHFRAVGLQMLRAHFVPSANNAALQEREGRFDSVGMNIALDVDMQFVSDGFVASIFAEMLGRAPVSVEFIGKEHFDIFAYILADKFFERATLNIGGVEKAQIATALPDTDYILFVLPSRGFALSTIDAADVGFIHLDLAVKQRSLTLNHGGADSVAEIPSRFVADSKCSLHLTRAHALFGLAEQVGCCEPLLQRQMSVIENRSGSYGELVAA